MLLDVQDAPADGARGGALPPHLARRYGADLTIGLRPDRPTIVSNFVSTLDGVVAFDIEGTTGGREVSGGFTPDRFLMGLLRATADAVLVGAGTVRSGHQHVWTPGHVHPPSATAYAAWRAQLGLRRPQPTTVIVSASGRIDPEHPGLRATDVPVVLLTTDTGAAWLGRLELPPAVEVVVAGDHGHVEEDAIVAALAARDLDLVVCEGGPRLLGGMVGAGLVDELFLTIAPQVAGRTPALPRLALVEGLAFSVDAAPWASLASVMRSGDHLFLRYRMSGRRPARATESEGLPAGACRRMGRRCRTRSWRPYARLDADRCRRSSSRRAVAGRGRRRCARRAPRRGSGRRPHADGPPLARDRDQARPRASRRGAAAARDDRRRGRHPARRAVLATPRRFPVRSALLARDAAVPFAERASIGPDAMFGWAGMLTRGEVQLLGRVVHEMLAAGAPSDISRGFGIAWDAGVRLPRRELDQLFREFTELEMTVASVLAGRDLRPEPPLGSDRGGLLGQLIPRARPGEAQAAAALESSGEPGKLGLVAIWNAWMAMRYRALIPPPTFELLVRPWVTVVGPLPEADGPSGRGQLGSDPAGSLGLEDGAMLRGPRAAPAGRRQARRSRARAGRDRRGPRAGTRRTPAQGSASSPRPRPCSRAPIVGPRVPSAPR